MWNLNFNLLFVEQIPSDFDFFVPNSVTYILPYRENRYKNPEQIASAIYNSVLDAYLCGLKPIRTNALFNIKHNLTLEEITMWKWGMTNCKHAAYANPIRILSSPVDTAYAESQVYVNDSKTPVVFFY